MQTNDYMYMCVDVRRHVFRERERACVFEREREKNLKIEEIRSGYITFLSDVVC